MNKYLIIAIVALLGALGITFVKVNKINKKYETAVANMKAYDVELSDVKSKNTAYQFTVNQLEYLKDSIIVELNNTREELKVKDKNLKALQYIKSGFSKVDTLVISETDTIFSQPSLAVDTLIGDDWYSVSLSLRYPSTVILNPKFKSEKHVVVSTRKETVNPPKKFFLLRWFQKKHRVLNVDVVEKNPYVEGESSRYIEVIK